MATGQLRVYAGIVLSENTEITTSVLNRIANPTAVINDRSITAREMDDTLWYPTVQVLTGTPLAVTMVASRPMHVSAHTLTGNRTLSFTGLVTGMFGFMILKQDGTGNRTITLPAGSIVVSGGGGVITLSTAANAIDMLYWRYDGTSLWWNINRNFT